MKISVIVCSKNGAEKIESFLLKIDQEEMLQSNAELVLVDNGSKDKTLNTMIQFKEKASFEVKVVSEPRGGLSIARNAGLADAGGEIIIFTDDDCYFSKGYLLKTTEFFIKKEFDYCGGQVFLFDSNALRTCCSFFEKKTLIPPFSYISPGFIHGCNMIFSRKVIDTIGLFDPILGLGGPCFAAEDTDYLARASWAGFLGARIPELIIYHNHGRKIGKDQRDRSKLYDYGRGAYFTKFILRGKVIYLKKWYYNFINRSWLVSLREVLGGLRYIEYLFIFTIQVFMRTKGKPASVCADSSNRYWL